MKILKFRFKGKKFDMISKLIKIFEIDRIF